jgi:pentatricopeptide repeat protein
LNEAVRQGNGVQAEDIVDQLLQEYEQEQVQPPLDNRIFSLVLEAWKNSQSFAAALRAHKLLEQMVALADQGILRAQPSLEDYHAVLECWNQSPDKTSADYAQEILLQLKNKPGEYQLTEATYELMLSILANGGHVDSAQQLLEEVCAERMDLTPTLAMHNFILQAWANSSYIDAPEQAQNFLRRMQMREQGMPEPDGNSYNIVIGCWSSSNLKGAVDRAEALLDQMKAARVRTTSASYQCVISALAKMGEAKRAEKLLTRLTKDYSDQFDAELKPDIEPFQSVLRAYSRSYHPDAALNAESMLTHMRELYQSEVLDTMPNVWSYNIVMRCWARSKSPEAGKRAKVIFDGMQTHGVQPDTTSINTVLNACANSVSAAQTEQLFWEFFERYDQDPLHNPQPDVISFSTVLKALVRSGYSDAPERGEALLNKLQELHQSGWEQCKPDVVAYASVIQCWAKSKRRDAPQKAESLLRRMQEIARAGNADMEPDTVCWNSAINAWAQAGNGERAEALFKEMLTSYIQRKRSAAVPNIITFTAVLSAWAKTRSYAEAPERAELLLQRMEQLYQSGALDVKPNVVSYSIVLNCLAYAKRKSAAEKAESILHQMISSNDEDIQPNLVSYNSVIKAWSFARDPEAVPRVTALLKELLEQAKGNPKMTPNANTFGSVLKTLADSHLPDKEKRAEAVVNLMEKFGIELTDWSRNQLTKCTSGGRGLRRRGGRKPAIPGVPKLKYS